MSRFRALTAAVATVTGLIGGVGLAAFSPASPASAGNAPLTIALITSLTGTAGPEFSDSPSAFRARLDLQNARGGVDGHKLKALVIDDATSPTQVGTAVQDAISKGAIGIVSDSPVFFLGAKAAQQAGIPVTGGAFDGSEWGTQPYTNMFAADLGSVNPKAPVNTQVSNFLRAHGGTVLGTYGYSISPSSTRAAEGTAKAFQKAGGRVGVLDTSIPFGGVEFTAAALTARTEGVNAIYPGMDNNSNFALATALEQAGVKLKAVVFPTGYQYSIINTPSWSTVQGDYFSTPFRPFSLPNAGTRQMASALRKYAGFSSAEFPSYNQYESWLGADLMITGLQKAGKNPTHAKVIAALRKVTAYNGNGLLPVTIDYAKIFGHDLPKSCDWYMQAQKKGFVVASAQPTCGTDIPGTSLAS